MSSINQNKLQVETMPLGKNNMNGTSMEALRNPVAARISTGISLFFFIFVFYISPVGILIAGEVNKTSDAIVLTGTPEQKMNQGLLKVQEIAVKKLDKISQRLVDEGSFLDNALEFIGLGQLTLQDVDELQQLSLLLAEQHTQAIASFNQTKADLIAKKLPEIILQRHTEAVTKYQASYDDMQQKLQAVLQADSLQSQQEASAALDTLMKGHKLKKTHQKTDPDNLPFGSPDASKTRKPANTPEQLSRFTGISNEQRPIMLAANVITPGMLSQSGGPVAEDLAETPDIKFTDAIKAKALELEDDPVKIYNWVRNNIEFIPSYGSIQGADYTLQNGKGNAFDTASLLIALYRAANIPARYAYGTVEVPVEKVMNWVGGVDVPEAAQQLLGQGGIPNVALINGGKITHIKMETVWAEAWVDYFPSRAAKHVTGDQWIPLDASFKQYEFTEGENLEANVPFDAQAFVDEISQSATINETEGYIQGVDPTHVNAALAKYQQQIEDYIKNQNPDATVAEVLGTQKVIVQEFQQLAAGLPYRLVSRTKNYSEIPNNLRHKFRYTLSTEVYGSEGSRLITFEQSLPELAGKKHALSFRPTNQADEDLIKSYLPEPDPTTGDINPGQFPNSLPGYLINMTAEFIQSDKIIHSTSAGKMGSELYETLALWSPSQGWEQAVNHPITGEYRVIGLDLQGVNSVEAAKLQVDVEATKEIFENGDQTQISALTKNKIMEDLLYPTIYSYLAVNDTQDQLQAKMAGVTTYRLPSYGVFSTGLQTNYWFGIPRDVSFSGLILDVDRLAVQSVADDNNRDRLIQYIQAVGARSSAMEHVVPEQMFKNSEEPSVQGISAIKALAIAASEGQKIWEISRNNLDLALSSINLGSDIESEIRNAVLAGKIATTHDSPVSFSGENNVGYLILDPETGAGAYKIAGGTNGGFLKGIKNLITKAQLFIGAILGLSKTNVVAKAILKSLGQVVSVFTNAYKFLTTCENVSTALILTLVFTLISVAIAIALFFVVGPAAFVLSIGLGFLESWLADQVIAKGC